MCLGQLPCSLEFPALPAGITGAVESRSVVVGLRSGPPAEACTSPAFTKDRALGQPLG